MCQSRIWLIQQTKCFYQGNNKRQKEKFKFSLSIIAWYFPGKSSRKIIRWPCSGLCNREAAFALLHTMQWQKTTTEVLRKSSNFTSTGRPGDHSVCPSAVSFTLAAGTASWMTAGFPSVSMSLSLSLKTKNKNKIRETFCYCLDANNKTIIKFWRPEQGASPRHSGCPSVCQSAFWGPAYSQGDLNIETRRPWDGNNVWCEHSFTLSWSFSSSLRMKWLQVLLKYLQFPSLFQSF